MATSVTLPALGESVTEGTVTRWLKQPGDTVAVDEPLLEVSTDKVDTEIPSPVAGTLIEIKVQEDETVEVGAELAVIGDEGESAGSSDGGDEASATQATEPDQTEETPAKEHQPAPGEPVERAGTGVPESLPSAEPHAGRHFQSQQLLLSRLAGVRQEQHQLARGLELGQT